MTKMELDSSPLVSIILITYKKYDGIYKVIDSLFEQTYSNIELIIQDDGAKNFNEHYSDINKYISENITPNIKNVIINHLEENVGTSRNINKGINLAKGKYIKLLTADDALYDKYVLQKCVEYCEKRQARILVGQTYTLPQNSNEITELKDSVIYRWKARGGRMSTVTPSDRDISYLSSLNKKQCNELLASRCIISTISVFYRKDIFDDTNGFPEKYRYTEDMPFWPYLAKKGEQFYFAKLIMMSYKLNGISNGGELNGAFIHEACDIIKNDYIPNEIRVRNFNSIIKKIRYREQDYIEKRSINQHTNEIKYLDVIMVRVIRKFKYLLLGTRL